jgi:hypothetical protein
LVEVVEVIMFKQLPLLVFSFLGLACSSEEAAISVVGNYSLSQLGEEPLPFFAQTQVGPGVFCSHVREGFFTITDEFQLFGVFVDRFEGCTDESVDGPLEVKEFFGQLRGLGDGSDFVLKLEEGGNVVDFTCSLDLFDAELFCGAGDGTNFFQAVQR